MKNPCFVRTIVLAASLLLQLNPLCFHSRGAAGDVDQSFDPGLGVNGLVNAVAVQADGKVIIGGQFTTVRGLARTNLARLNADGSGDPTFNPGKAFDIVDSLALQPDGKVLVGSQFIYTECYDDWGCYDYYFSMLTRLHPNGALDAGFSNATVDVNSPYGFSVLTLQPDGKVLVGGYFNSVNGTNRNGIARLNANGTLDTSFDPGTGIGGHQPWVFAIAVESDGNVIVGGIFDKFNGTNHSGIARLHANGSLDNSFNPGPEVGYRVESIAVQADGKLLVGGYFGPPIARLNSDGSLDSSFNSGIGADGVVWSVAVQSDGKVLIGGQFSVINDANRRNRIARLNADGSLDSSFIPGTGINGGINSVVVQSDGKVLVGGGFTTVNDTRRNRVARLNADGSLDVSFDPGQGLERAAAALALQPDGKVLMGGQLVVGYPYWGPDYDALAFVHGTNNYGRTRLNANGTPDHAFSPSAQFNLNLTTLLHPEDCLPNYSCYQGAVTTALLVQTDGKVLIAGYEENTITGEETFYQIYRYFLARFSANGSLEINFDQLSNSSVRAMAQQPDGKIVIGGSLNLNGTHCTVARLHPDGSVDGSFQRGQGPDGVACLALQPDGRVVAGGQYGVARLNSDGSREACFNPSLSTYGNVSSVAVQPDGKVLLGGSFSTVNGLNRNAIARLQADGSLDGNFDPGSGVKGTVSAIVLQPDGKVLIAGNFFSVNGVVRPYVARLLGDAGPSLRVFAANDAVTVAWPLLSPGFKLQQTADGGTPNWMDVTTTPVTVGLESQVAVAPPAGQRFFRLYGYATNAPTNPLPAPVASRLIAVGGNAQVSLSWTAFAGATGHHVQRATDYYGQYATIATPGTTNYTDTTVTNGTTYFYKVSVDYPCGESAGSVPVGVTPYAPSPAIHVQSITMSWVASGSRYKARAVVKVVDNAGAVVSGATVYGSFSGSINNAGLTGVTAATGNATITSTSAIRNGTITFTISSIYAANMGYNSAANVVTSATISR